MYFVVYEGDVQIGTYNLVSAANLNPSPTGEGWYSSGSISVPLVAGKYYLIETQWDVNANYYNQQNTHKNRTGIKEGSQRVYNDHFF